MDKGLTMARYIALLRAVNVGGTGKLRMKELSQTLETAGYLNVQTVLASGNVVLDTRKTPTTKLASQLETLLIRQHGLTSDIMVRTPKEWAAMIDANPMPEAAGQFFGFWCDGDEGQVRYRVLTSFIDTWKGPEQIEPGDGCLYIHYTEGMGKSKFTLPKTIGVGTVRNWNTVHKLLTLT